MAYKVKNQKFISAIEKNRAYKLRIAFLQLQEKAYEVYGSDYDNLNDKEKQEIALLVQKEYPYLK